MTTTYELYTNENGTPKAVEGKAPAIIERVENLETSVENLETSVDNLETSVENLETSVETAQTTADACLPLSGGTMTGAIYGSGGVIRGKTDDGDVLVCGGTASSSSSYIQLNGGSRTEEAGDIILVTKTPTSSYSLRAKTSGALTWGDKSIICVEAWNGESSWYRKYSDGFIEQGGTFTADPITTVTYPLAFTKFVASIFVNGCTGTAQNPEQLKLDRWPTLTYFGAKGCYSTSTSSGNMTLTGYWYACGY